MRKAIDSTRVAGGGKSQARVRPLLYRISKRILDCMASGAVLLLLAPLLLPVALALRFSGEGYIWYRQERVGYRNKPFSVWKFATMLKDSPNMGSGIITVKGDPRVTPLGGALRRTKINELPQLMNILFGDMSLVGPRPVMAKSFNAYPESVREAIYQVPPGLTGIGSIIFRDEESLILAVKERGEDVWDFYNHVIYPYKGSLELWYQHRACFWVDAKLIVITAWAILFPSSNIVFKAFDDLPAPPRELVDERMRTGRG